MNIDTQDLTMRAGKILEDWLRAQEYTTVGYIVILTHPDEVGSSLGVTSNIRGEHIPRIVHDVGKSMIEDPSLIQQAPVPKEA
jgi:hypothetical protein